MFLRQVQNCSVYTSRNSNCTSCILTPNGSVRPPPTVPPYGELERGGADKSRWFIRVCVLCADEPGRHLYSIPARSCRWGGTPLIEPLHFQEPPIHLARPPTSLASLRFFAYLHLLLCPQWRSERNTFSRQSSPSRQRDITVSHASHSEGRRHFRAVAATFDSAPCEPT